MTLNLSRVTEVSWPTLLSLTKVDMFILMTRNPGQSIHHSVRNLLNLQKDILNNANKKRVTAIPQHADVLMSENRNVSLVWTWERQFRCKWENRDWSCGFRNGDRCFPP